MTDEARDAEAASQEPSEEQRRREVVDQLKRLRVADLVEEMLVGLVSVGYQKLGLTDKTRELRDLRDARLAIETLRAWIEVLSRERGDEGLADLRSTVAAMQLSYARVAVEAPATPGAEEGAAPLAEDGAASQAEEGATPDAGETAGSPPE